MVHQQQIQTNDTHALTDVGDFVQAALHKRQVTEDACSQRAHILGP
jgi:hypothetical protein